jgi:hypothetical protein
MWQISAQTEVSREMCGIIADFIHGFTENPLTWSDF